MKQTFIYDVEGTKPTGVLTIDFIEFKGNGEDYKKQLAEKNKELTTNVTPLSLRASIEDRNLQIFIAVGCIEAETIAEITKVQIKDNILSRGEKDEKADNLFLIIEAVSSVTIRMDITDAEDQAWSLYRNYLEALRDSRLVRIPDSRPHIAISYISDRLKPRYLKSRRWNIITLRKIEEIDKMYFNGFLREISKQTRRLQQEWGAPSASGFGEASSCKERQLRQKPIPEAP